MHSTAFDESLLRICLNASAVESPPICRPERSDPHPGRLHHGCHGRVLRAAHRRGEGSIPGPDEPERRGSALQRHHAGLQTDIPAGGLPRPLERCVTLYPMLSIHFDPTVSLTLPLPRRDSAQHHEKRAGELHRAGDVRPDQRGHPEAQPPVW